MSSIRGVLKPSAFTAIVIIILLGVKCNLASQKQSTPLQAAGELTFFDAGN